MSVLIDINRHTILGPIYRQGVREGVKAGRKEGLEKGLETGLEKGLEKGLEQGIAKGSQDLVLFMLAQRFGKLAPAPVKRIRAMSVYQIQTLSTRLFEATSLDDLLNSPPPPPLFGPFWSKLKSRTDAAQSPRVPRAPIPPEPARLLIRRHILLVVPEAKST